MRIDKRSNRIGPSWLFIIIIIRFTCHLPPVQSTKHDFDERRSDEGQHNRLEQPVPATTSSQLIIGD